jgi:hypothetical protein
MDKTQREPTLPSYRKKALDLLGKTRAHGMEEFSTRLFEYEMSLITLLMAELDEAQGELQDFEVSDFSDCRASAGAFARARVHARYQDAVAGYLADRLQLKTALHQLLQRTLSQNNRATE